MNHVLSSICWLLFAVMAPCAIVMLTVSSLWLTLRRLGVIKQKGER